MSCSWLTRSGLAGTASNIRLQWLGVVEGSHRWAGQADSAGPGILPAMHETQEPRPRARSPFTAAFLSLLFPGLGQWYAGATMRALAFAAAPILAIALLAGIGLRMDRIALLGLAFDPNVLNLVF